MQKARCCDQPTLKKHTIQTAAADMRFICYLAVLSQEKRGLVFRSDTNKNISVGKKP